MKKNLYIWTATALIILSGSICTACEDINEMPDRTDSNVAQAYYKVPDPVILNADEMDTVNKIKEEYNESVSQ